MGCCNSKKKVPVQLNKYENFHDPRHKPSPTNNCDKNYFEKVGENATFGVGNFWRGQAYFSLLPGVLRARCGFCGGKVNIGDEPEKILTLQPFFGVVICNLSEDHTQVVDLEFDPAITSYGQLLDCFWSIHDPTTKAEEVRYKSKIIYHTPEQKKEAEDSLMAKDRDVTHKSAATSLKRVYTTIEPATHIFVARKEEQQYYLQEDKYLMKIVNCTTADELAFSHLATKLNALCSGYATMEDFDKQLEVDNLELDEMAVAYVREKIKRYSKRDKEP